MSWHYRRYRPNAFNQNQKGTCRKCGEPIYFIFDPNHYDQTRRTKGAWAHEGYTIENYDQQDHYPAPKEFCAETVTSTDYDDCAAPVKYEDIKAENYACGRHMRKWLDDKAYRKRAEEADASRKEKEALEEFEAGEYDKAAAWIKDNGFESLIETNYVAKPRYSRLNRHTKVDVFILYEFLKSTVEKLADKPSPENYDDEELITP